MLPEFFKNKLIEEYSEDLLNKVEESYNFKRPLTIRINNLKTSIEEIKKYLSDNDIEYNEVSWYPNALIIKNRVEEDLSKLPIYEDGLIYFQSLSSMLPPIFLNPREQESILDMTASPGGKTTEMCCLSNNKALITAVEKNQIRYDRLKYNLDKQGATKVSILKQDARFIDDYYSFEKILLDAPCSGSGTLSLKNNNLDSFNEELITRSSKTQKDLIMKAFKLLKPNGTLVYSTCSILKEENDEVIKYLLDNNPTAEIIHLDLGNYKDLPILPNSIPGTLTLFPNELYEGFFIAKIKKTK